MRSSTVEGDPAAWVEPAVTGWSTPDRDAAQLLIRQIGAPQGWRARVDYEVAHCPDGRRSTARWIRRTRAPSGDLGISLHPTDWGGEIMPQVHRAWADGDQRFVAWPL